MSTNDERRRFFRIEDFVHLSLTVVPPGELDRRLGALQQRVGDSFTLMTTLGGLTQQAAAALRRIEARDPDVADYLKALDKKLELIARAFLAEEVELADRPARAVNLSAGGMALHSRDTYAQGQVLEIKMLLLPSYTGILSYGTVVECIPWGEGEEDLEYPYRLRVDFSFMRDSDRDALIRHVLLKQAEGLRRRREQRGIEAEGDYGERSNSGLCP
jgi:PilZ domain